MEAPNFQLVSDVGYLVLMTVGIALMAVYFGRKPANFRERLLWYLPNGEYTREQRLDQLRAVTWQNARFWMCIISVGSLAFGGALALIICLIGAWQYPLNLPATLRVAVIVFGFIGPLPAIILDLWLAIIFCGRYSSARRRIELDTAADAADATRRYPAISPLDDIPNG